MMPNSSFPFLPRSFHLVNDVVFYFCLKLLKVSSIRTIDHRFNLALPHRRFVWKWMTHWCQQHSCRGDCPEHFEINSCCRRLSTQIDYATRFFLFEIGAVCLSISYFREVLLGMPPWPCCSVHSCMWLHAGSFQSFSFGLSTGAMVSSYLRLHLLITAVNTAIFRHQNYEQWTLLLFSLRYCLLACFVVEFCHSAMGHPLLIILFSNSASQASVIAWLTTPSLLKQLLLHVSLSIVPL